MFVPAGEPQVVTTPLVPSAHVTPEDRMSMIAGAIEQLAQRSEAASTSQEVDVVLSDLHRARREWGAESFDAVLGGTDRWQAWLEKLQRRRQMR